MLVMHAYMDVGGRATQEAKAEGAITSEVLAFAALITSGT